MTNVQMVVKYDGDSDFDVEEYVRSYLKETVAKHVKIMLEHQLQNIVAAKLAELNLTKPESSPSMDQAVKNLLQDTIDARIRKCTPEIVRTTLKQAMQ